jgi:hypothetical protein
MEVNMQDTIFIVVSVISGLSTILLTISELLALNPKWKSNSNLQLIANIARSIRKNITTIKK